MNYFFTDEENDNEFFKLSIGATATQPQIFKRICYFPNAAETIYWSVSEVKSESVSNFGVKAHLASNVDFKLVKLHSIYAKRLMLKKLRNFNKSASIVNCNVNVKAIYADYDKLFENSPMPTGYLNWIVNQEPELWRDKSDSCSILFSIIVPTYNAEPAWLDACFNSVVAQNYANWQLIIVDDASNSLESLSCLKKWHALDDDRLVIVHREKNGHICAATNSGIQKSTGDFLLFLDHDDMLAPQALNELALSIAENPQAKVFYSDEDLMSEAGERIAPHFKSDWNIELLRSHNYVTHLCCYEKTLLDKLGGMHLGYEGAQDYDLILRASEVVGAENIIHIPKVLYHWRMVEGSTASDAGAKNYATEAGLKALTDHIHKYDSNAMVCHADRTNFYKVDYALPQQLPLVSIIIPTRDGLEVLKPCIETLITKTAYENYEVIVLDNGSVEPETLKYLSMLSSKSSFKVIRDDGGFNYSRINNHAVAHADGELVCLLNNDIEITNSDWLSEMVSLAIRPTTGCVGAKLLYPDNTIQHAGVILGLGGYAAHSHRGLDNSQPGYFCRAQIRQQLSAVTAACLVIRKEIYEEVGGLDEAFVVAYNDVDFCLRVQQKGYKNIYTPYAELLHHESKTRGDDNSPEKQQRFDKEKSLLLSRWGYQLANDPFYNPNLTRSREDFSI
ncbi:glycosyltransferase family 2 protein [Pelagibaculum spongiae]|uniref:glycosyltransferase family 2 protein n=1 Tax=Pelagibaculum spongiae TaxID=2080658 RepID=UPI0013148240|nr:glycosyltransferase family 2 protein [Pelagibaculum spongiae]